MRAASVFRNTLPMILLVLTVAAWASEQIVTEVVATQRPAGELLPALLPLTGDDVSAQAFRGQLILRGPASRIAELKAVLEQIDRPMQNLRVSVRRASSDTVSGGIDSGRVQGSGGTVEMRRDSVQSSGNDAQQLVMLEGTAAWLSLDTEVPVLGIAPNGAEIPSYAPLGNGLELRPVITGEQVRLEISQRVAHAELDGIRTETIQSVLMLTPGVWIELGNVAASDKRGGGGSTISIGSRGGGIDRRRDSSRQQKVRWEVKVDLLSQ